MIQLYQNWFKKSPVLSKLVCEETQQKVWVIQLYFLEIQLYLYTFSINNYTIIVTNLIRKEAIINGKRKNNRISKQITNNKRR